MYKEFIKKYIPYLTVEHIEKYARIKHIPISSEEAQIIYTFIQQHSFELLENDTTILQLKGLLSDDLYQRIVCLYYENKSKYC